MNPFFAKVLIIDDEMHARLRTQLAFEKVGFHSDMASDGREALQMLAKCDYHAVVTELILPHTNGGELVIGLCGRKQPLVVIVQTRLLEQEVYDGLMNEGVDAVFYKPTDYSAMARRVKSLVARRLSRGEGGLPRLEENDIVQVLRSGDAWIQHSGVRTELFRFSIVILACALLGLGWGNSLDGTTAGICKMFGLCGLAFYLCLELVAYHRDRNRSRLLQWSAERRLGEQLEACKLPTSVC
jgi:DNA-binding response OmpR family regulator